MDCGNLLIFCNGVKALAEKPFRYFRSLVMAGASCEDQPIASACSSAASSPTSFGHRFAISRRLVRLFFIELSFRFFLFFDDTLREPVE